MSSTEFCDVVTAESSLRVLLVEPWLTGSHEAWANGYAAHSRHSVEIVGLEGRSWRWRLVGGASELAAEMERSIAAHGSPDVVFVSGLVDVARLLGLCRPFLGRSVPVAVFQHESQLCYPTARTHRDAVLADWFTWLAADRIYFGTDWHRNQVMEALPGFLGSLPDGSQRHRVEEVAAKTRTLGVGVDLSWVDDTNTTPEGSSEDSPLILWPHRWENDKDPLAFGRALDRLEASGAEFRLVLAGAEPTIETDLKQRAVGRHSSRVVADGPFTTDELRRWMAASHIVVSCAHHEFFGMGVVEAVAAGCQPLVPDALAYPETLGPGAHLYPVGSFGAALERLVHGWPDRPPCPAVSRHGWSELAPNYDDQLAALATARH